MSGKHEKQPAPTARRRFPIEIVLAAAAVLILAALGFFAWKSGALAQWIQAFTPDAAETSVTTDATSAVTTTAAPVPEDDDHPADPVFARPDQMRAVTLTAGVDYAKGGKITEACRSEIDALFDAVGQWTWNTVLIPLPEGDAAYDAPAYILQKAREKKMFAYFIIDCGVMKKGGRSTQDMDSRADLCQLAADTARRYAADGFLLTGFSYPFGEKPEGDPQINTLLTGAIKSLRRVSPNAYIGLLAESVWAHASSRTGGSETANIYEQLTDGGADTRKLVQDKAVDFIMVKDHRPVGDYSASFEKVLNWWSALCKGANVPLYISHSATSVAAKAKGFATDDQLARQILLCQKADGWCGSAFDSLAALGAAPAADGALKQAFDGTLMEEYISRTLTLTSPAKTAVTTYDSSYILQGSADPNFPLTVNGTPVALTDHGYFSMDVKLNVGQNTFTFETKGIKTTYTVTYQIQVLKSVSPTSALTLDGGTTINISAVAHHGSTVSATVGGTTIAMSVTQVQAEEDVIASADYDTYTGTYTLPAGLAGQTRALGTISVRATYGGRTETRNGGTLSVKALPKVSDKEVKPIELPNLTPIDPSKGGDTLAQGTIMVIKADYAETFNGDTTDDYSRPTNAYLPKGTTDRLVKTVYDSSSKNYYYLLGCGRRVYTEDAVTYIEGGSLAANALNYGTTSVSGGTTAITFSANWRIPYQLQLLPQKYASPKWQDYTSAAQTTEYIELTFYYTTSVTGTPDVSKSPLFSKAEWKKGSDNTYVLRLYLTKTAQFYGYGVMWDNAGRITFTFRHPTYTAGNDAEQPLKGFTVVLDPGHGGNSIGTAGGKLAEKTIVLTYSQLIRDKLQALGAKVIMTRSTDKALSLLERTQITRPSGADLFVSVHMNGSSSASAHGCSIHYFSDYSIGIANTVCNEMKAVYTNYQCPNSAKVVWSPFYVCRISEMPSLLLECGYMTNAADLERLIAPDFQDALTSAVVRGITSYAKSLPKI